MTYFNEFGQARLGWNVGTPSGGGGSTVDTDAQAFITAASITDSTQQSAINTLVTQLKTYGIWTKMKALYPFVGGTASSHKFNLKDPRDLDAAFRLVFNGGWTHSSTGAKPNGTTAYADTKLNDLNTLQLNNAHISVYLKTNIDGIYCDIAANDESGDTNIFSKYNNLFYARLHSVSSGIPNSISSLGLFIANRISSTESSGFQNNNKTLLSSNSVGRANRTYYLAAANAPGYFSYSPREQAFASIGDGLSDAEAANFYTAVQTFQTTLGRQVGVPIVADSDAQAFLNAAVITDTTQASAINTLVTSLKSANIWTKMKAIYPFVGGTATTHKFNLKDPRDLDAAYRLVFNGGWTHSATGALPNGSNAYADSKFIPLNNATDYNAHLSYYSRTNNTTSGVDIGAFNPGSNYFLQLWTTINGGISRSSIQRNDTDFSSFVSTTRQGHFIGLVGLSGFNSFSKIYQDGVLKNTNNTNNNITRSNTSIYLGAFNANGSAGAYVNRESAFASIGDSLTDAEATAFYNAVQVYQTTLGRQV